MPLKRWQVLQPSCRYITELSGGHFSSWSGLHYKEHVAQLQTTLERCWSAQLKPPKKLLLTTSHLIPHYLYKTVLATPPISTIRAMDQTIRNHVKVVLHFHTSTPNGLLYCSKRDGGLGIPKLEALGKSSALKQGTTLPCYCVFMWKEQEVILNFWRSCGCVCKEGVLLLFNS